MSIQSSRWAWLASGLLGLTAAGVFAQTTVTITSTGTQPVGTAPTTVRPTTGDAKIAQALAKTELAQAGITQPTPAQMQAALNGGTVTRADGTTVVFKGVVTQHQSGMGWGQIANAMGVKLGSLVSATRSEHAGKKEAHESEDGDHTHKGARDKAEGSKPAKSSESAHASGGEGSHGNSGGSGGGGSGGGGHGGKK